MSKILYNYVVLCTVNHPQMKRPKFLDQVREVIHTKHSGYSTEETYVGWIYHFITFHKKRHPEDMGSKEIDNSFPYLVVKKSFFIHAKSSIKCIAIFIQNGAKNTAERS